MFGSPGIVMIKRFLPHSLLGRSLMILVIPLILLQIITTIIFYERHWSTITLRLSTGLAGEIAVVIRLMERYPDSADQRWLFSQAPGLMSFDLQFLKEKKLSGAGKPPKGLLETTLTRALNERLSLPFEIDTRSHKDSVEINVQLTGGVLHILANKKRLYSSTTYILILWMVGASLVLFAIAFVFMRNQVRPIRRLAEAADAFGKGQDILSFKPGGASEVRLAAAAFKLMRARILRQISQRTEMLAGVSHDLGTVLTRMKLEIAMLPDTTESRSLSDDVAEMEKMIEGYLAFTKGEGTEQPKEVDLDTILADTIAPFRRKNGQIEFICATGTTMSLRIDNFRRCISNLIANAMRYADKIKITAKRRNDTVEILIEDDGPGIPENIREDVFKPFFRGDPSRNLDQGGIGLGLSISRDIIHGHGGNIHLDQSEMGGLKVLITLPV
ncbi:MAG: HAMP domain-containing protein [Rhodospirillaceae bacterium]|nr:HAMP domain-containing protein [Rhodospirillaceae bacterium]MBT5660318.1 HAMP domain-containing protein [Rhodospirillaceae bacterium]MBT5751980.1 HAMP domain-containing protein [Rhodospirillaceae bacterium]